MFNNELQTKPKYKVDLQALMAACETNYWRIKQLLPDLESQDEYKIVIPVQTNNQDEKNLFINVIERCRYTTTIELFEECNETDKSSWGTEPHIKIRIYHDAKSAEVIAFQYKRAFLGSYEYPNRHMYHQDEKAQLNVLLGEWLNYCLQYGHRVNDEVLQLVSG